MELKRGLLILLVVFMSFGWAYAATTINNPATGVNITTSTYEFDVGSDVAAMKNLTIWYNTTSTTTWTRLCGNVSVAGQAFYNLTCTVNTLDDGDYNFKATVNDTITGEENSSVILNVGLDFDAPTINSVTYTDRLLETTTQTITINCSDGNFEDGSNSVNVTFEGTINSATKGTGTNNWTYSRTGKSVQFVVTCGDYGSYSTTSTNYNYITYQNMPSGITSKQVVITGDENIDKFQKLTGRDSSEKNKIMGFFLIVVAAAIYLGKLKGK